MDISIGSSVLLFRGGPAKRGGPGQVLQLKPYSDLL